MKIKVALNATFSKIRKFDDFQIKLVEYFFFGNIRNFKKSTGTFFA